MKRFHERMQPTAAPRREGRNLFRFHDAPAHAPAAAAPRAPVPDLLPAPPPLPPLRLVGLGEEKSPDGPIRTAYISGDGQLFISKVGDEVLRRYKVTKISEDVVELT